MKIVPSIRVFPGYPQPSFTVVRQSLQQAGKDNYTSNNPGLSADAAEYLVSNRVNAVAIDGRYRV